VTRKREDQKINQSQVSKKKKKKKKKKKRQPGFPPPILAAIIPKFPKHNHYKKISNQHKQNITLKNGGI
jgi:hypothetical protein